MIAWLCGSYLAGALVTLGWFVAVVRQRYAVSWRRGGWAVLGPGGVLVAALWPVVLVQELRRRTLNPSTTPSNSPSAPPAKSHNSPTTNL